MRKLAFFLTLLFVTPLVLVGNAHAESDAGLEEAGITMVALRNDSLDLNQDGGINLESY